MKKKSHPAPTFPDNALRRRLMESVLAQVPFDGWTDASYAAALQQTGIARAEADKQFPHGLSDVVEFFGASADAEMQKRIEAERDFARLRVRDKVAFGVRARLEPLTPHREALRRLMVWYALPHHMVRGIKRFYKTVDLIWLAAGDTSTDYNFYTKRILLASVLKATTLFWLNDESPHNQASWDFLDRRISDVMKLGKSISLLKEFKASEIVGMVKEKIRKAM
jgi:ubiquinone biosynthesis protein COQ9